MQTLDDVYNKAQVGELWVTYLLFILFVTSPIGVLFCLLKLGQFKYFYEPQNDRDRAAVKQLKAHYQWLVNTFAWAVAMAMAALGTMYYMIGFVIALFLVCWWVYRLARGMLALIDSVDLPVAV